MGKLYKRYKNGNWFFRVTIDGVRTKVCTGSTDSRSAKNFMQEYLGRLARRKNGLATVAEVEQVAAARKPLEVHLDDWEASLRANGGSENYAKDSRRCVDKIAEWAVWTTVSAINDTDIANYADKMITEGFAARTRQKYVKAVKQFVDWLVQGHKIAVERTVRVIPASPKTDRKIKRRMILPQEWDWIVQALQHPTIRQGMTSEDRLLLYDLAIQTGFRNSELRAITAGHCHLKGKEPFIFLPSEFTKNNQPAKQYIRPALAMELIKKIRLQMPEMPLFNMPRRENCAEMLRGDIRRARKLYVETYKTDTTDFLMIENSAGESIDFHALRHTCGAWLAIAQVHPKQIQKVMRHSTIVLTMEAYGHLIPDTESSAVMAQGNVITGGQKGAAIWSASGL